ncbi:MAG: DUF5693 family protein [Vulcanimicrobiaceae bacterium]
MTTSARTRYAAIILALALLAAGGVALLRMRVEMRARRVEIAMDYNDFSTLARSYGYNPANFLIALRRAGLTSLALSEELGSNVGAAGHAYVLSGVQLLDAARLSTLKDPALASLVRAKKVKTDDIYLVAYDASAYHRYRQMLALHFQPKSVTVLRKTRPWIVQIHTQLDYFDTIGLGIPRRQISLARRLGLEIIPRFQNDERFHAKQIDTLFASLGGYRRVSTVIFFGLRNQVLGYPHHIKATAAVLRRHGLNFGTIEVYDPSQLQRGNAALAQLIPGQTVRVQAIAKLELDKLKFSEIVERYLLGVRERNIRVVYLRPYAHEVRGLSIEKTNVALVQSLARHFRAAGFTLGRATPIPQYKGSNGILVFLTSLAVPSIFLLLLDAFGWYRRRYAVAAYAATVLLFAAGLALHHEMLARSLIALAGGLLFAGTAFLVLAPTFRAEPPEGVGPQILRGVRTASLGTGVVLLGALIVVGMLSTPLAMEEIDRFRGVKMILVLPPLIALCLYLFSGRYGTRERARDVLAAPLRAYHLVIIGILGFAAALLVMRSGNQSEIAPSALELWVRQSLTDALSIRPRFKEFLIGVPAMTFLPALALAHRRAIGWLFALGIGVGLGDVIDTFSHLHTPLLVSIIRVFIALVLGAVIGAITIVVYRMFMRRFARS